jgi:CubicO group peptidase (beta-lactamase class C family)
MTVRHLLNQTSGMSEMAGSLALADLDDRPDATERQARALSGLKLKHLPGAKVQYCNLNFNLLGLIIEATSGEAYTDYIQKHIFNPLGMRHSYISRAAAQQNGLAKGHRHWFSLPFPAPDLPIPRGSLPSGQLISCAEDMAHYLIAHLNSGRYGGVQILSSAGIAELQRGVAEYIQFRISGGLHGMGWFTIEIGQTKTISHGGNVPDFSAFMALVPEQKKGIVMLLNADPYGLPIITEEIGMGVTALLSGQQPAPIKLDFIQWIVRLLPLIPLLQVAGIFATLRRLRSWRQDPVLRPAGGRMWGQQILLPLIPNLSLAAGLAYLQSNGLLRFLHLFMPDLAWIAQISGSIGLAWSVLRSGLVLQALRKP